MQFMQTLLPEPVVPAISTCGILEISAMMGSPEISSPRQNASLERWLWNCSDSTRSFRYTVRRSSLGTSIPMAALPGIGANMRTPDAARLRAISSDRFLMRLTFTPDWGCSSNIVTVDPMEMRITRASIPKLRITSSSLRAVSLALRSCSCRSESSVSTLLRMRRGGRL